MSDKCEWLIIKLSFLFFGVLLIIGLFNYVDFGWRMANAEEMRQDFHYQLIIQNRNICGSNMF